jgi:hypothetical protein
MSKKSKAEKKFLESLDMLQAAGECPVNYALSYVRGYMKGHNAFDYLHEFEDGCMRIRLNENEQIH